MSGVPSPPLLLELALEALPEVMPPLDEGAVASAPEVTPESAPQVPSEQR
jgi:hypothetical protein